MSVAVIPTVYVKVRNIPPTRPVPAADPAPVGRHACLRCPAVLVVQAWEQERIARQLLAEHVSTHEACAHVWQPVVRAVPGGHGRRIVGQRCRDCGERRSA